MPDFPALAPIEEPKASTNKDSSTKEKQKDSGEKPPVCSQTLVQGAQTPSVSGSWCIRPFVCSARPPGPGPRHLNMLCSMAVA